MLVSELGTRQHCRDNVTMFSGLKVVGFTIATIFVVSTQSTVCRHRDHNIFQIFPVPEALLCCRVVIVAKLKHCRLPSSVFFYWQTGRAMHRHGSS